MRILPSLTTEQVHYLTEQAECVRDMAIISLFADSGLRLSALVSIKVKDIDWQSRLIKVSCTRLLWADCDEVILHGSMRLVKHENYPGYFRHIKDIN